MSRTPAPTLKQLRDNQRKRWSHSRADKFDKVRDHVLNGTELDEHTQTFYERAVVIWSWLVTGMPNQSLMKLIKETYDLKQTKARELILDTKKLFNSEPAGTYQSAEKQILIEMVKEAYEIAKQERKPRDMVAAAKLLGEWMGIADQEGNLQELYEGLELPTIVYTDDPTAFFEPEQDGDFEEIPPEEKALPASEGAVRAGE